MTSRAKRVPWRTIAGIVAAAFALQSVAQIIELRAINAHLATLRPAERAAIEAKGSSALGWRWAIIRSFQAKHAGGNQQHQAERQQRQLPHP